MRFGAAYWSRASAWSTWTVTPSRTKQQAREGLSIKKIFRFGDIFPFLKLPFLKILWLLKIVFNFYVNLVHFEFFMVTQVTHGEPELSHRIQCLLMIFSFSCSVKVPFTKGFCCFIFKISPNVTNHKAFYMLQFILNSRITSIHLWQVIFKRFGFPNLPPCMSI